ncbi:SapC family protein [Sphingomonas sp. HT-1]|uniref:SapC family protein n=1 Tax=unclassified Sphingomonas TaxID=196159 RepID=UPI0002F3243E|nr:MULTISPECIES: SapC family protein [unclassified Sphingomonas]KTF69666.1 multidrug transporter [Sphingomonas sp. WG]
MAEDMILLDSAEHRGLRLRPSAKPLPHFVPIVPEEFAAAAACCPVLLTKDAETGRFYTGAILGFEPGETLVELRPDAGFWPLVLERDGFLIAGESIAIDARAARFSTEEGEPLFGDDGTPAPALRRIQQVLAQLHRGADASTLFIDALLAHGLVEPIDLSLRFDDGRTLQLAGLYTVSLDGVHALDDATALGLFRSGQLALIYAMAGSLRQIPVLAARRNRQLAA